MSTGPARSTQNTPQLLVRDLDRAVAYYRDRLGFKVDFVYQVFFASLSRDGFTLTIKAGTDSAEDELPRRSQYNRLDAHFPVNEIDALFEDFRERGARIVRNLERRPWGTREFFVEDLDGHILCFTEK